MKILALETSTVTASCAICSEDRVICEIQQTAGLTHSQTLLVMVQDMFKTTALDVGLLDAVVVASGPGSFTGLRIGVALAKGIAKALNIYCVGISTLFGLACNFSGFDGFVCPVIDARNGYFYSAVFDMRKAGFARRVLNDSVLKLDDIAIKLNCLTSGAPVFLVGDGAISCYATLQSYVKNLKLASPQFCLPKASSLGFCGIEYLDSGFEVLKNGPNLEYLRLSQAERQRREKLEKDGIYG